MNNNIHDLFQIANKNILEIIGLMSGTSLDGLDVVLCSFEGSGLSTEVNLKQFATLPYTEEFKQEIRRIFAKDVIDFRHLCILNSRIGVLHGEMILECLKRWKILASEIDVIASHGQTVYHAPKSFNIFPNTPNATLQIGDGDHVAVTTEIITISDFRQKHIAAGGEGAPLAVYGDYLLFSSPGETRIMLNIGGIANFTYLPGNLNAENVFSTDTGPGNTLIDHFTLKYYGKSFDNNGNIALNGIVNQLLLQQLKSNDFFKAPFPKTSGPELFNENYVVDAQLSSGQVEIPPEDLIATLTRFSAETIAESVVHGKNPGESYTLFYSGGGAHNKVMMKHLKSPLVGIPFRDMKDLGIPGDAKEAVLFATLANEALRGGKTDFGGRSSVPSVSMGKISFPN